MKQIKMMQLNQTLEAAQIIEPEKQKLKGAILSTIGLLAQRLQLRPEETLHCFASPHQFPNWNLASEDRFPPGFGFVIPDKRCTYEKGWVKFCFWIENGGNITHKATCTTFISSNGWGQIADDCPMPPNWVAAELAAHLREGRDMPYCVGGPFDYVDRQILPLLGQLAA